VEQNRGAAQAGSENGAAFSFSNAFFLAKLAFFVVGLLSIYPTREFLSWGKALKTGRVPVVYCAYGVGLHMSQFSEFRVSATRMR
jgi:putative membrane protein